MEVDTAPEGEQLDTQEEYAQLDWVALLRHACIDEKVAPDILEFKGDIIQEVTDMANEQAKRIEVMESNSETELERIIYERDQQRTRWLIKSYYRTRLRKLEKHVQYYLHHAHYTACLSPQELEYAKTYFTCIGRHAQRTILVDLPLHFQSFTLQSSASEVEDMIPEPELNCNVMTRPVHESCELQLDPNNPREKMTMNHGDIVVIQYNLIKDQLRAEQLHLT